jgi:hypothetical protein
MDERDFAHERRLLASLNRSIKFSRDGASEFLEQRKAVIKLLDSAGVDGKQIAQWAGVSAMIVSRVLNEKEEK